MRCFERRGQLRGAGCVGLGLRWNSPGAVSKRLLELFRSLGGILLAQGLVQNKGQSVFCIPNGNVNSPLHTGLPCKMPQKSDQWPQGS